MTRKDREIQNLMTSYNSAILCIMTATDLTDEKKKELASNITAWVNQEIKNIH